MEIEVTIIIKDEERTLSKKEIVEDGFVISRANEELLGMIARLVEEFGSNIETEAPKIVVKTTWVFQE